MSTEIEDVIVVEEKDERRGLWWTEAPRTPHIDARLRRVYVRLFEVVSILIPLSNVRSKGFRKWLFRFVSASSSISALKRTTSMHSQAGQSDVAGRPPVR